MSLYIPWAHAFTFVCIKEWRARKMSIERTFIWPRQMTTKLSFSCHYKKTRANTAEVLLFSANIFCIRGNAMKGKALTVYVSFLHKIFIIVCLNCERSVALRGKVWAKIYFRLAWNAYKVFHITMVYICGTIIKHRNLIFPKSITSIQDIGKIVLFPIIRY